MEKDAAGFPQQRFPMKNPVFSQDGFVLCVPDHTGNIIQEGSILVGIFIIEGTMVWSYGCLVPT